MKPVGAVLLKLQEKINNESARIGIIGLGYVGLPLAVAFSGVGFKDPDLTHVIHESINAEGLNVPFMLKTYIHV